MKTLIVHLRVIESRVEDFIAATRENMANSRKEPGISRFELLRDDVDPCRFVLVEAYRDDAAQAAHKETAHYFKWKELAESMLDEPRTRALYSSIEP